jgi:hypothetical protein
MVNVFITVDTELSPYFPEWQPSDLQGCLDLDIWGRTKGGDFGIEFQMDLLNRHGLKAVFFVEALFASAVGIEPLREIVRRIQDKGHEVQLHLHAEWLEWIKPALLPGRTGYNIKDFSEEDQALLIGQGLANLRSAGAENVCAYRAGNYGADFRTLRALARNGVAFDTSYNPTYFATDCGLRTSEILLQPTMLEGVYEFPITVFQDWPGHRRHLELCACSSGEMAHALLQTRRLGWHSVVIVSHSFELLKRRRGTRKPPLPDRVLIRRFERLCRCLAEHREDFRTTGFADIKRELPQANGKAPPIRSGVHRTAVRVVEQAIRRFI